MEITLKIPTDYSSVTLKKWLALMDDIKNYEGDEEAITTLTLHHLCDLDPQWIKGLSLEDMNMLRGELSSFISNTELPFQRFITIDGVEYGFEPNLSQMPYGAYLDITQWDTITIDTNWAKIMSILYRPVTKKKGELYQIQGYDGKMHPDKFLNVGMDVHFGALFFFTNLSMDLLNATLNSLKVEELAPNIKSILARSGKDMHRLSNWQPEILQSLKLLQPNR
jgi:hypothetical protein